MENPLKIKNFARVMLSVVKTDAQGVGAKQVNSLGEVYETKYGITVFERREVVGVDESYGRGVRHGGLQE